MLWQTTQQTLVTSCLCKQGPERSPAYGSGLNEPTLLSGVFEVLCTRIVQRISDHDIGMFMPLHQALYQSDVSVASTLTAGPNLQLTYPNLDTHYFDGGDSVAEYIV